MTHVQIGCITRKLTRTDFTESDTRTVIRIDIGRNLKNESGKLRFIRFHLTLLGLHRTGTRSNLYETVQKFLNTEVIQCRTEKHRSAFSCQISLVIEFRINTFNQFQITT